MAIFAKKLAFLHSAISLEDLVSDNKLLPDSEIAELEKSLLHLPDGRYSKKNLNKLISGYQAKYSIIKFGNAIYAIFHGYKKGKYDNHLHRTNHKKVKLVQNLITGDWLVIKMRSVSPTLELRETGHGFGKIIVNNTALDVAYKLLKDEFNTLSLYSLPLTPIGKVITHISETKISKVNFSFLIPLISGFSLHDLLSNNYKFSQSRYMEIAMKIFYEVKNFYSQGLLHRDLKIENIMYDFVKDKVTLIDLDTAGKMDSKGEIKCDYFCGTDIYIAPEIYAVRAQQSKSYVYDERTEVYALGTTLKILFSLPVSLPQSKNKNKIDYFVGDIKKFPQIAAIEKVLNRMTAQEPHARGSLDVNMRSFLEIYQSMPRMPVKTAIIELNDVLKFYEKSNQLSFTHFITALFQFDEICIVDVTGKSNSYHDRNRLAIQKILERQHSIVGMTVPYYKDVLILPRVNDIAAIPEYFDGVNLEEKTLVNNTARIFTYFDISRALAPVNMEIYSKEVSQYAENGVSIITVGPNKTLASYLASVSACTDAISNQHYQYVITGLKNEITRLEEKYPPSGEILTDKEMVVNYRKQMLDETLNHIKTLHARQLSYALVDTLLLKLGTNKSFATKPKSLLVRKAQCVTNVEALREHLQKSARRGL